MYVSRQMVDFARAIALSIDGKACAPSFSRQTRLGPIEISANARGTIGDSVTAS
jgi:hypothetical protein